MKGPGYVMFTREAWLVNDRSSPVLAAGLSLCAARRWSAGTIANRNLTLPCVPRRYRGLHPGLNLRRIFHTILCLPTRRGLAAELR